MNVNCPGCNSNYKIDEARIPLSGQKMRCPKCSVSFRVNKDGSVLEDDSKDAAFDAAFKSIPPAGEIDDAFEDFAMPSSSEEPRPSFSQQDDSWGDPFSDASKQDDAWEDPFSDASKQDDSWGDPFSDASKQDDPFKNKTSWSGSLPVKDVSTINDDPFGDFGTMDSKQDDNPFNQIKNSNSQGSPLGIPAPGSSFSPDDPFGSAPAEEDDFDLPSPGDYVKRAQTPAKETRAFAKSSEMSTFGQVDISMDESNSIPPAENESKVTKAGIGSVNFGQIDMGDSSDDSGEFDAFPVQEDKVQSEKEDDATLDLAEEQVRAPLDAKSFGSMGYDNETETVSSEKPGKKTEYEGRRRLMRRQRKLKIAAIILLFLIGAGGSALHFTQYGIFGVNFWVKLLPDITVSEAIDNFFETANRAINNDSVSELNAVLDRHTAFLKETSNNADVRILGVYLHNWHQLRFGLSEKHENTAVKLMGKIDLSSSPSEFAPLAKYTRDMLAAKYKDTISELSSKSDLSLNKFSILAMAYLGKYDYDNALKTLEKATKIKASLKIDYLKQVALVGLGRNEEALKNLEELIQKHPNHFDSRLLFARLMIEKKVEDTEKIIELVSPINEAAANLKTSAHSARVHSLMGKILMQRRRYDLARQEFNKAEAINPRDIIMLTGMGQLALMANDLAGALALFRNALTENKLDIDARLGMAETLIKQEKYDEGVNIVEEIITFNDQNARAYYLKGLWEKSLGRIESAQASFKKAIELDVEILDSYIALAATYTSLKNNMEAMKVLDTASRAVPDSAKIKITLAENHANNEDFTSAIIVLNEALELEPVNPVIHFKMAQMYRKLGFIEDAQNALDEVVSIDSQYHGLSVEQGFLMELSGRIDDALATYEKALKENPHDIITKTRVAAASLYKKKFDRAKELLVDVLNENPNSADGNFYMGEVFRLENSAADAIPYYRTATELDPNNPLFHVRYGAALVVINDFHRARQRFDRARELEPKMAEIYLRMGMLMLRTGAAKDSISQFEKALSLDSDIEDAHLFIGQALEDLGDLKAAASYYLKATQAFPDSGESFYKLGVAYLQILGNARGLEPLKRAVSLAQQMPARPSWLLDALYHLGSAQKATRDRKGAIETYKTYLEIAPKNAIDVPEVEASLNSLLN